MYGTDVQLIRGKPYRTRKRVELLLHEPFTLRWTSEELVPGEGFLAWSRDDHRVEVNRNTSLKEQEIGETMSWEDFSTHCEPVPEGSKVWAQMLFKGPFFTLLGLREDMDGRDRDRDGDRWVDLEEARLICEVLASGQARRLDKHSGGRLWKLEWTFEDMRHPAERRENVKLADQPLWFLPGFEDLTMLQMSCRELIQGFNREVNWLLRLPEQTFRTELNALIVLLDQATLRVGL